MNRHALLITSMCLLTPALAIPAAAHHGWGWTTGKDMEIVGTVTSAKLGNPHGTVVLDVKGQSWTIEVGQPWRNKRAGLQDADFTAGKVLRIIGEPSARKGDRKLKAEKIYIGDKLHNLYPDR